MTTKTVEVKEAECHLKELFGDGAITTRKAGTLECSRNRINGCVDACVHIGTNGGDPNSIETNSMPFMRNSK